MRGGLGVGCAGVRKHGWSRESAGGGRERRERRRGGRCGHRRGCSSSREARVCHELDLCGELRQCRGGEYDLQQHGGGQAGRNVAGVDQLAAPNDVRTRFAHSTARCVLVDGTTVIANNWDDLVSGSIRDAIDHDENGAPLQVSTGCAWTATDPAGAYTPSFDCMGWTSTGDDAGITGTRR